MDVQKVIRYTAVTLDANKFDYRPATPRQVRAVNIILRLALRKRATDANRYALLGALLNQPLTSTRQMTMGQASAIIYLSRHMDYSRDLERTMLQLSKEMCL